MANPGIPIEPSDLVREHREVEICRNTHRGGVSCIISNEQIGICGGTRRVNGKGIDLFFTEEPIKRGVGWESLRRRGRIADYQAVDPVIGNTEGQGELTSNSW